MSDDEDELAAIRAARGLQVSRGGSRQGPGAGGGGRSNDGPPSDDDDAYVQRAPVRNAASAPKRAELERAAEMMMEEEEMDAARLNFPMSFGQNVQRGKTAKELEQAHAENKRAGGGGREELEKMVREARAAAQMSSGPVREEEEEPPGGAGGAPGGGGGEEDKDKDDDDDSSSSDDDEDDGGAGLVPCSHEGVLKGHSKPVNIIALDPSGSRLLSGGADGKVKFWDFNGMDTSLKSFRELTPYEGQQVVMVQYSNSGDKFLCATTKNQCVLYSRDGAKECEFIKGDMYVHDQAQTKGHVAALVACRWHPTDKQTCLTAGIDGTVRLWDLNTCDKKQVTVLKTRNAKGQKAVPHSVVYTPTGDIVAGCDDGCVKIWDAKAVAKGSTQKAHMEAKNAHQVGAEITSVCVSADQRTLLSRARDDTLKVWDFRKLSEPLASFGDLENFHDGTAAIFSPANNLFLTGTSARVNKKEGITGVGAVHVYDRQTLQPVRKMEFPEGSCISLLWHPKINQLFVGSSTGHVHCLYDPKLSNGGMMRSMMRAPKKSDITNVGIGTVGQVYAPHALPMFRQDKFNTTSKQKRKDRADPVKSHKPELGPVAAAQKGLAYPGMQTSRSFAQHLFKESVGPSGLDYLNQDPREALLKYADEADKNPMFTAIYKETQPDDAPNRFDLSEERAEKRAKPYVW